MKPDLINKINLGEYVNCYLKTNQVYIENDAFNRNEIKLYLTICADEHINESWTIELKGVCHYHNLLGIAYMPHFTIDLEDHHPLLWHYLYDIVECELGGTQDLESKQMNELIGELPDVIRITHMVLSILNLIQCSGHLSRPMENHSSQPIKK